MSLDLEKHLVFVSLVSSRRLHFAIHFFEQWLTFLIRFALLQYGAYHHNSVNVAIHMICVPLILVTAFTMVCLAKTQNVILMPS